MRLVMGDWFGSERGFMSMPTKPTALNGHQVHLFNRALHPELFPLKGRRVVSGQKYELETWVMPGSHVLRFQFRGACALELMADGGLRVPNAQPVASSPALGEHDFEYQFDRHGMVYMATIQSENLPEHVFDSTYHELLEHGRSSRALIHRWMDEVGPCLSMLDIQPFNDEAHVEAYHMFSSGGLVIRTQTVFEHE
ncbi:DUF2617 family protein [Leptolyngbya sp. 7M]|uniref:DUF2617 family protein n=1 Tax=Leptolyngbya sp. 7M TaxID=2812896 RepID=UPI001B8B9FB8|nr:DUF2617 family protein [Leptolyngbya sp. 7M]QYO64492.1 DUF2617 family protein [Leptolyngbya sp. 7M]QYU69533.1 DUF2617 family protein [Leptolyngbya sp. 15MV]